MLATIRMCSQRHCMPENEGRRVCKLKRLFTPTLRRTRTAPLNYISARMPPPANHPCWWCAVDGLAFASGTLSPQRKFPSFPSACDRLANTSISRQYTHLGPSLFHFTSILGAHLAPQLQHPTQARALPALLPGVKRWLRVAFFPLAVVLLSATKQRITTLTQRGGVSASFASA
jgi:hypothetical protein